MSDISKCVKGCDKEDTCYRWWSKPTPFYQAYTGFKPDPETGECEGYWEKEQNQ